jgi:hypothetical protein
MRLRARQAEQQALITEGEFVVGFRAWQAEVAGEVTEDLRHRPEGNKQSVGSRPAGRSRSGLPGNLDTVSVSVRPFRAAFGVGHCVHA